MPRSNFDEFVLDTVAISLARELDEDEDIFYSRVMASVKKHYDREALIARIDHIDTLFQDAVRECIETVRDRVLEECQ